MKTSIWLLLAATLAAATAGRGAAQTTRPADFAGRYEGIAKSQSHGDVPVVFEVRQTKASVTGQVKTPLGDFEIVRSRFDGRTLTLTVESYDDEGIVTLARAAGGLTGELVGFGEKARLALTRVGPPSPIVRPVLSLRTDQWRADLRFLAEELPRRHKSAFHRVSREQFERAVADLDARIPTLSDGDVVMEISRIAAMIGDGHTNLGWRGLFPSVPIRLFWFGNELRVVETVAAYRRALGARVVEIGGVSANEALRRDLPYISQGETPGFVLDVNAKQLTYPAHLHALGLARDANRAVYTFEDERGRRLTLNLRATAADAPLTWLDAAERMPLSRSRSTTQPLWYRYLPEKRTLYLNFSGYPRRRAFGQFSREFFDFFDRHAIDRVVVDMRQNGGGDLGRGREFVIAPLQQRPAFRARGKLFVIVGRQTFSAGMANAVEFRKTMNAIIVGEPTGQRPNSYSENRGFTLPNSHLGVSYSTEFHKLQDADTPGLIPDIVVEPDWASYERGRDTALERILAYPSGT
jgi:hypothetical protein